MPIPHEDTLPDTIGRFEIRGLLGGGGFGLVYRAYDPRLDREVAIKVPRPGRLDSAEQIGRFAREARVAAQLRHPNIVPIFDASDDPALPYIAFAFIDGQSLAASVRDNPPELAVAVRIVADLADALAYAHASGIVHRDVKAENVLIDYAGRVHLTDFGLARFEQEQRLTQDGSVTGTPGYLAPEIITSGGNDTGAAADQYALGVLLYELIAGRPPFEGQPDVVYYHTVYTKTPSPRTVRPDLPRDLETVCMKALAKRPEDRYKTCQLLADDVRRWLAGEPVLARPLGPVARLARWARREPVLAGAVVASFVTLLAFATFVSLSAAESRRLKGDAERARDAADLARTQALDAQRAAVDALRAAESERDKVSTLARRDARRLYAQQMRSVREQFLIGDHTGAAELLAAPPQQARGPEWGLLNAQLGMLRQTLPAGDIKPRCVAISGTGRWVAAAGATRVAVWDLERPGRPDKTFELPPGDDGAQQIALSPDGQRLAVLTTDRVISWTLADGKRVASPVQKEELTVLTFRPDGQSLLFGDRAGGVYSWRFTQNPTSLFKLSGPKAKGEPQEVHKILCSADGKVVAALGLSGAAAVRGPTGPAVRIPDVAQEAEALGRTTYYDEFVYLTADGRALHRIDFDEITSWDTTTGNRGTTAALDAPGVINAGGLALSDGRVGILSEEARDLVLESEQVKQLTFRPHLKPYKSVAVARGGGWFATAADDEVRVWSAPRARAALVVGLSDAVAPAMPAPILGRQLGVSADGARLVAINNNALHLLRVADGKSVKTVPVPGGQPAVVALSRDGKTAAAGTRDGKLLLWKPDGAEAPTPFGPATGAGSVTALHFSPDGAWLLVGTADGIVERREVATGKVVRHGQQNGRIQEVVLAPDGAAISVRTDGRVTEYSAGQPTTVVREWSFGDEAGSLAVAPDGAWVAVGGRAGGVTAFRRDGSEPPRQVKSKGEQVLALAFTADGSRLTTYTADGTLRFWMLTSEDSDIVFADKSGAVALLDELVPATPTGQLVLTTDGGVVTAGAVGSEVLITIYRGK